MVLKGTFETWLRKKQIVVLPNSHGVFEQLLELINILPLV